MGTKSYNYNPTKRMTREEAIANPQPVCVLVDGEGLTQGVLVQVLDEKFVIDSNDFNDGKEMTWYDAMKALNESGKTTFTMRHVNLIFRLLGAINAALQSAGCDELASYYWTATEWHSYGAWYVYFGSGYFGVIFKCTSRVVRAVAAF